MAFVSPRMSLKVWNSAADPYDHEQLADNFLKLDQHDHSPGRGTPIGGDGIRPGSITQDHIYPGSVGLSSIADGTVTWPKLANDVRQELVTALPSAPVDRQIVYYLADAALGLVWTLRYRAAASSAYRWEFIGGSPLRLRDDTGATGLTTALSYVGTQQIVLPVTGEYALTFSSQGSCSATAATNSVPYAIHSLAFNGTPTPALSGFVLSQLQASFSTQQAITPVVGVFTAGTVLRPMLSGVGAGTFAIARIAATATPVRLAG